MRVTKPKDNQLLIEDDTLRNFKLKVSSKTGLNDSYFNNLYEGMILGYRLPNMDASKQMFMGSKISLMTLYASMTENLLRNDIFTEKEMKDILKEVIKNSKR